MYCFIYISSIITSDITFVINYGRYIIRKLSVEQRCGLEFNPYRERSFGPVV